jgi:hypothetical protein
MEYCRLSLYRSSSNFLMICLFWLDIRYQTIPHRSSSSFLNWAFSDSLYLVSFHDSIFVMKLEGYSICALCWLYLQLIICLQQFNFKIYWSIFILLHQSLLLQTPVTSYWVNSRSQNQIFFFLSRWN